MPTTLTTKYLEDASGNKIAPVTTPGAVRWEDGDSMDDFAYATWGFLYELEDNKQDALVFATAYDPDNNPVATVADVPTGDLANVNKDGTSSTKYLRGDATWQTFPSSLPANGGNSQTVNNHTVLSDVPANAVFTDTTYESKTASSGGTAVSLCTTGEKYTWNSKQDALTFNTTPSSSNKVATMADIPSSLPANGGNAATVNNHTVGTDVPSGAVFTDTTYSAGTNITLSGTTINAKGLPVSAGTATSLANLPVTNRLVVATISSNQSTVSISNGVTALTAGCELHVIIIASADVTITLPSSSPYVNCNDDSSLEVASGTYAELNFISDGTSIYVRAIS